MRIKKAYLINNKKNLFSFFIVILISIFLECCVFNYKYILSILDSSKEYNINFREDEILKINWKEKNGIWLSESDPQLIIESVDKYVDEVLISYSIDPPIDNILLFYTNNEIKEINGELLILAPEVGREKTSIKVKDYIGILRIDLGEEAKTQLRKIEITLNPANFQFSISRVVACLLIYLITKVLFIIQKIPDFELDLMG